MFKIFAKTDIEKKNAKMKSIFKQKPLHLNPIWCKLEKI